MDNEIISNKDESSQINSVHTRKMSPADLIYSYISLLGINTKVLFLSLIKIVFFPFKTFWDFMRFVFNFFLDFLIRANKNIIKEADFFFNDLKVAKLLVNQNIQANKHQKESNIKLLRKFFKIALIKHKQFFKRVSNYIVPSLCLIVFFIVVGSFSNINFALAVNYNNNHIGYIENENVFRHAKELLEQRLEISGEDYDITAISQPEYKIAIVNLNELSDSNDICEQLIQNSDSGLTTACGIYVDNKFIGSVKNESDASSVFKSYISAYCRSNNIDPDNSQVILDLVEKVSYVQGLYSENTLMDSDDLREYLQTHSKSEIVKHTMTTNETAQSICQANNLSLDQFFAINPGLNQNEKIKNGTSVNILSSVPFINVSVSKMQTKRETLKYNTVKIETDSLYRGVEKVITDGVDGEVETTTLITYVNNKETARKQISSLIVKKPVEKKVYVGTKPIPNNISIYGNQSGVFIWPTIGANTVTSGFGYRYLYGSTSFHRGIDIAGSGASGRPVIASADGVVEKISRSSTGYGHCVLIDHGNGIKTRYAHCKAGSICVNVGQSVVQGQMIAKIGSTGNSTGPHLHFEIIYNGSYANPTNYLKR